MPESFKLVLHVAQVDKWEAAIGNAANFLKTASPGEHLEIRIVANSDAVLACAPCSPKLLEQLEMLTKHRVEIYLCENSLKKHRIPADSLPLILKTVPAGIRALVELQNEGWRYVRP
jgi:intracellular sulfur oxidation DsrE/DsrF family protein